MFFTNYYYAGFMIDVKYGMKVVEIEETKDSVKVTFRRWDGGDL